MKISVGKTSADLCGNDNRAIQEAVDRVSAAGGGSVELRPGRYICYDAVRMKSGVRLVAEPGSVTLAAGPTPSSALAMDADVGEKQITPVSCEGFQAGMGVILRDNSKPHTLAPMPLTVTRIENGTLFVNDWIIHDWIAENGGQVVAYAPLIHAFEVANIEIDGLVLDGTRPDAPEDLDGLRGQNLYFRRVKNALVRNVDCHHAYGDGIRFGQSVNVAVEDCEVHHNGYYGVHAGSHSRPVRFSRLNIHHNDADGMYICWGIQNSRFEDSEIYENGRRYYRNGFSIGHKDTDNLITGNHIHHNAKHGIAVRIKTEANGAHRNRFVGNRIENNGSRPDEIPAEVLSWLPAEEKAGCGVDIQGITRDLVFENNIIRDTRGNGERRQVRSIQVNEGVSGLVLKDNEIDLPVKYPQSVSG